ncbi:inner membrane peptidase. Serine peptidase. MEROPS family S49 [Alteromonadaceae bacterium Bs31]|nr:inner membrane peptidase. Serine peptidase. MEROPS family S49 [Alteromonadaceae bacterium Bs31]
MEFLFDYGLFLAKAVTLVIAIIAVIAVIAASSMRAQGQEKGHIEVCKLNDKYEDVVESIKSVVLDQELLKLEHKDHKKKEKENKKRAKALAKQAKKNKDLSTDGETTDKPEEGASPTAADDSADHAGDKETVKQVAAKKRVFVTDFDGDIKASDTENLRKVVTAIISLASKNDEVVIRLESQGGMVHSYGLAASQLARITAKGIPLTACVDKVAASGGYMMACVANKIVSAPFAIIGSIGVVAQLPNFHKLLKKNDVDYEMFTAGEYKRTITMFGENTEKGKKKFVEDLEDTHVLFKDFIRENREVVDIDDVATGEIWFGTRALDKKLIDELATSDQYLMEACENADVFEIKYLEKKTLPEKLGLSVESAMDNAFTKIMQKLNNKIFS